MKLKAKEVLALPKQMKLVEKTTNILQVFSGTKITRSVLSSGLIKEIQEVQGLSILNFCLNFFLEVLTVFQSLSSLALFFNDISMWEISPLKSPLKTSKLICAKLWSIQMQMSENDRFDTFEAFQTSFTLIHNQNHCHLENIKFYLLTFRQQVSGKLAGSVQQSPR